MGRSYNGIMTKVLLFDFWGTLVENGVWSPTKQVQHALRIDLPFSEFVVRFEQAMMTKPFPSLLDAFKSVCSEFGVTEEGDIDYLVGMWNKSWMLSSLYPETKVVLEKLKKKYRLVLISNTDNFSISRAIDKFGLVEYFEKMFLSYEQGMIKTDELFYPTVLEMLHVNASDCVMIGDSIQSDIEPAQRVGIRAILVDRKGRRDHGDKIGSLFELEKLL